MPPRPKDVAAHAASVRAVLQVVRNETDSVLGLVPEGHNSPQGIFNETRSRLGKIRISLGASRDKNLFRSVCTKRKEPSISILARLIVWNFQVIHPLQKEIIRRRKSS